MQEFNRKHPYGKVGLEDALAEFYHIEPEEVLVTSSSSEAIYLLHRTLLKPGDEVLVPVPNYPAELNVPVVVGARVRPVALRFDEEWRLPVDRITQQMGPKTRLLSITNAHNPTGLKTPQKTTESLLDVAKDSRCRLLSDEAFRGFAFEKAPPPAVTLGEQAISLGTMSKYYGLGDLRIGWALAERGMIKRLRNLKTWGTSTNSRFSEYVAKQVLENHKWFDKRAKRFLQRNLESARRFMKRCRSLRWVEPDAAPFGYPEILIGDSSLSLCKKLADGYGILLDPGLYFGRDGYVRVCFTQEPVKVENGFRALETALDELSAK